MLPNLPSSCPWISSLSRAQTTHSHRLTSISQWWLVMLPLQPILQIPFKYSTTTQRHLLVSLLSTVRPPTPCGRLLCYHHPLLFASIPWSLFRFQTPFGWSIGLPSVNGSEGVWTVVDSLLEGQLPHIPLIYSSLHWLMEKGVTGQAFIVEEAWPKRQINTVFFFLQSDTRLLFALLNSQYVNESWSGIIHFRLTSPEEV